ncbi:hypothetical protein EDEG_01608 [Edhazardia aedis USNM 41457]|uniref:Ssl1-like domain-containing protein n=1 Tax=Edhazardia aedis (strain USNM 41457) TaxID=1003232 RepID=J9D8L6_EDHAE|nr:hypothetical protein EDEG_01608 [Edhazardia aedis USNM 41457]|eukprot:EJW04086.1 hypothetical protein EDEG_01608 [Edhazardia aedis USNM 41457]
MEQQFSWEKKYTRSWQSTDVRNKGNEPLKRHISKDDATKFKKLGLIRHFCIVVDHSTNIDSKDFLPSFRISTKNKLEKFVEKFSEDNPISTLTVCVNSNKTSESMQNLNSPGDGFFSLKKALETGYEVLKDSTNIKEMLLIIFSLSINDRNGLETTIENVVKANIKVNIINLCAELKILKTVCDRTGGKFCVPLDDNHYETSLMSFLTPTSVPNSTISLIQIGFPKVEVSDKNTPFCCVCHLKIIRPPFETYSCVKCSAILCSLPVECPICDTLNASSIGLCKNIHHFYVLEDFVPSDGFCVVCNDKGCMQCQKCLNVFCRDCNSFLHDNINFCFYCEFNK